MICKETTRLLCEYLEGRLSPKVSLELSTHVRACQNCQIVVDAARKTLEVYFNREPETRSEQKLKLPNPAPNVSFG